MEENAQNFILYTTPNGDVKLNVLLLNIFDSGELEEISVSPILEHTASDGKKYVTKFYNLDAINKDNIR